MQNLVTGLVLWYETHQWPIFINDKTGLKVMGYCLHVLTVNSKFTYTLHFSTETASIRCVIFSAKYRVQSPCIYTCNSLLFGGLSLGIHNG